jgi:hypothetical protein
MTFEELLAQVMAVLQREGRVSYRALKRPFDLTDDDLADLHDALIAACFRCRSYRRLSGHFCAPWITATIWISSPCIA